MWYCEYCPIAEKSLQFIDQSKFTKHLRLSHLQKYKSKQGIIYRCCYGINNICQFATVDNPCEFDSEKSYENHLIKRHMKTIEVLQDSFVVSDSTAIENSITYKEVRNIGFNNNLKKWTPFHSSINLPAVLNDPNNRQLDIFSRTWGEAFEKAEIPPCVHLRAPEKSLFASYIEKVRSSQKYRERILKTMKSDKELIKVSENSHFLNQKPELKNVPKIFFRSDFNLNNKDVFSSVIPIFVNISSNNSSNHKFTLLDNTLHYQLTKNIQKSSRTNQKWIADNSIDEMNDKLSFYLNVVEINIAKQVSIRANSFFEAVSTQDKVRDKLLQALTQIAKVRLKLSTANECLTKNHWDLLLMYQRRINLQNLLRQLQLVKTIHSSQSAIQTHLSTNDLCGALDLISDTESLLFISDPSRSSSNGLIGRLSCLKHVKAQLSEMRLFVEKMVQQEYINAITNQLRVQDDWILLSSHVNDANTNGVLIELDYQLIPSLLAMLRIVQSSSSHSTPSSPTAQTTFSLSSPTTSPRVSIPQLMFVQLYQEDAMEQTRTIVKSRVSQAYYTNCQDQYPHVSTATTNDSTDVPGVTVTNHESVAVPSTLADQMRCLDYNQWMKLMTNIIQDMHQLLDKIKIGCYTMLETIKTQPLLSEVIIEVITEQISKLPMCVIEEIAQRIIKLVRARSKNGFFEKLSISQLVQMNDLICVHFINQISIEADQNRFQCALAELRQSLSLCCREQITRFCTRFHNEHLEKLSLLLDSDLWRPADVPNQIQEMADLISSQTKDIIIDHTEEDGTKKNNTSLSSQVTPVQTNVDQSSLIIDQHKYTVASAALILVRMVVEYCRVAHELYSIDTCAGGSVSGSGSSSKLYELCLTHLVSLLDKFNSQSCQLVLGARARKLVELETISARNLAVVSRSLQLISNVLLPRIKNQFTVLGSIRQSNLSQIDKLHSAISNHVDKINCKLIDLLDERIQTIIQAWLCRPPAPSREFRAICQQFSKMHEAICGILPLSDEKSLFMQVHRIIKKALRSRIQNLNLQADNGPQHVLITTELGFYISQLNSNICALKSFKDDFKELWK